MRWPDPRSPRSVAHKVPPISIVRWLRKFTQGRWTEDAVAFERAGAGGRTPREAQPGGAEVDALECPGDTVSYSETW